MSATREVVGACPLDCPDTCSWIVTVRDGVAVDLRGDRRHPYTRGALCAKVHRYLDYTRAPDRLLHPLRRTGAKGEGRFARITWDEALDEIATRWQAIIARHGPQALWPYYGSGTMGALQGVVESAGERGQISLTDVPRVEHVQREIYRMVEQSQGGRNAAAAEAEPQP